MVKKRAGRAQPKRPAGITFDDVRRMANELPGIEEGPCYGTPGLRVKGKFLARLWEDGDTLVLKLTFDDKDFLLRADPSVFFTTDHYDGYPSVLIRLSKITSGQMRELLETSWRRSAPKRLIADFDQR